MKTSIQKILILSLAFSILFPSASAFAMTANDQGSYVPYTGAYAYGANMGYYGAQFQDQDVAQLAYNAGFRTIRPSLPDWLITGYGVDARIDAFRAYQNMGMKDLTAFVGEPNNPEYGAGGPDNRETRIFPGSSERARTFKGLYEPIWLDSAKTQINPANTYANYMYKTVEEYGPYVKFWEIVNEPDFTYSSAGWEDKSSADSWWNVNPSPNDLGNLKAPIFYYVRELRVAYDVIKTLQPNEYVATGGIGYASFLDTMMRNTDNPVDGSVTSDYPLKGGAYFDVLSFHSYPMYSLREWSNDIFGFIYKRHSDAAVDVLLSTKTDFQTVLTKYGYGSTYPQKQWIVTETDMPQKTVGGDWGSQTIANNYIMKAEIMAKANGISQIYKYGLGEDSTSTDIFNTMGVYGPLDTATSISTAPKTEQFKALATVSNILYGKTYDAGKTAQLALPSTVRGVAFRDTNGLYTYALWAKTTTDQSENVSATYTFPFAVNMVRREWDYSATNASVTARQTVTLTGSPSFFTETTATTAPPQTGGGYIYIPPPVYQYQPPVYSGGTISVNAGADMTIALTRTPFAVTTLTGTVNNSASSYVWQEISGPSTASFDTQNAISTTVRGLVRGTYIFRLTANDGRGNVASDDVSIAVTTAGRISTTPIFLNVRASAGGRYVTRVPSGTQGFIVDKIIRAGVLWNKVTFDNGVNGWVRALYLRTM
jgi:hypothetical protein